MNLLSRPPVLPLHRNRHGETAHVFGDGLAGILHHPAGTVPGAAAVILLNAGMVQRMGPYRGSVQLAGNEASSTQVVAGLLGSDD